MTTHCPYRNLVAELSSFSRSVISEQQNTCASSSCTVATLAKPWQMPGEPFQRSDPHEFVGQAGTACGHMPGHSCKPNQLVTSPADLVDFLEAVWYDLARCG
jgi:hypothetical protein